MTDNTKTTLSTLEAPASWNTRYLAPNGFVCQITLRGDTGKELLDRATAAMAHLIDSGCKPYDNQYSKPKGNWHGSKPQSSGNLNQTSSVGAEAGNEDQHRCPIHNVDMKRWEKDGRIWYSHKTENGWCTGK